MVNQFYAKSLTLLLSLIAISAFCQKADSVYIGELQTSLKGYHMVKMFGNNNAYFYTLRENRRKKLSYAIQKIDADSLTILSTKTFNFPDVKGEAPVLESVISIGKKNYFITSTQNSENDTVNIFGFEILDPINIAAVPKLLARGSGLTFQRKNGYRVFQDPINNLFTFILPQESEVGKNEKFELRLFDENLNLIHSKSLELPYPSELINYQDAVVDSAGSIYVLTGITNPTLTSVNEDRNIGKDFSLFKYSWDSGILTEKSLSLGVKWLYDVKMFINSKGNLQIAGYYSNMVDLIMAGTFSLELDRQTGKIFNQGLSPFDRDFRVRFRPRGSNITETQLGMFRLNNVFSRSGDKTMLLSEKNYTESSTVFNPATGTYAIITIYNYDEILISVIDASSKIKYTLSIPKFQSSTISQDDYTSFLSFRGKKDTYLIYNDDQRNEELSINADKGYRQLTTASNSEAILISVSDSGKTIKTPLFTTYDFKEVFNPSLYYKTNDGIIITAINGYETRYIRLKLP